MRARRKLHDRGRTLPLQIAANHEITPSMLTLQRMTLAGLNLSGREVISSRLHIVGVRARSRFGVVSPAIRGWLVSTILTLAFYSAASIVPGHVARM